MSAVSAFMVALKQASDPTGSTRFNRVSQKDGINHGSEVSARDTQQSHDEKSKLTISGGSSGHQGCASGVDTVLLDTEAALVASNKVVSTEAGLLNSDSMDSLFSDGESHHSHQNDSIDSLDEMEGGHDDRDEGNCTTDENREPTWASDGELFLAQPGTRPWGAPAAVGSYPGVTVRDFASPEISPKTIDHPPPLNPFRTMSRNVSPEAELNNAMSVDEQFSSFGNRAFRKTFQGPQPALPIQQEYAAWHSAYQEPSLPNLGASANSVKSEHNWPIPGARDLGEAGDWREQRAEDEESESGDGEDTDTEDQEDTDTEDEEDHDTEDGEARDTEDAEDQEPTDPNPPYQLGMEPVGFLDGIPIFADIDMQKARLEIKTRVDELSASKDEATGGVRQQEDVSKHAAAGQGTVELGDMAPFNDPAPYRNKFGPHGPKYQTSAEERKQQSGFGEVLRASQGASNERAGREVQANEIHIERRRAVCKQHESAPEPSSHNNSEDTQLGNSDQATERGRQGSPGPVDALEGADRLDSRIGNLNEDEVAHYVCQPPTPLELDGARFHAHYPGQDEEDEEECSSPGLSSTTQIPGLIYYDRPRKFHKPTQPEKSPQPPMTPTYDQERSNDINPETDVRESIEPETPRRLIKRACTPAFEDRSPTPSPTSLSCRENDQADVEMGDAPPAHESEDVSTTYNKPSTKGTVKSRPALSSRNRNRRKSAVQGSGVKVEKPRSKVKPPGRDVSRKTTVANTVTASTSTDATATATVTVTELVATTPENARGNEAVKRNVKGTVKEAIEKIEANIDNERPKDEGSDGGGEDGKAKKRGGARRKRKSGLETKTATPPTRRSRRLMEKRGETPEMEMEEGGG